MEYACDVCGQRVAGDMMMYIDHTEQHVMDLVKHDHPEWVETNGLCCKCLEYYRQELKGAIFGDVPCVLRQRKIRNFFGKIRNVFQLKKFEKSNQG